MITEMNGKRHEVRFESTLLVPAGDNIGCGLNFFWAGDVSSPDNTVHVIMFKTDKKDDFVSLMEQDLKELKNRALQTDSIKNQIVWIEKMLNEVSDSVWVKQPEQPMLEVAQKMVSNILLKQGRYLTHQLTKENTIYTSGVTAMYEVQ